MRVLQRIFFLFFSLFILLFMLNKMYTQKVIVEYNLNDLDNSIEFQLAKGYRLDTIKMRYGMWLEQDARNPLLFYYDGNGIEVLEIYYFDQNNRRSFVTIKFQLSGLMFIAEYDENNKTIFDKLVT